MFVMRYERSHLYTCRHTLVCNCCRETPDNSCQGFVTCNTNQRMLYHLQPFCISGPRACVCVCVTFPSDELHASEISPQRLECQALRGPPHLINTVSIQTHTQHTNAHTNHSFDVNDYVVPQQSIYTPSSNNTTHYAFTHCKK